MARVCAWPDRGGKGARAARGASVKREDEKTRSRAASRWKRDKSARETREERKGAKSAPLPGCDKGWRCGAARQWRATADAAKLRRCVIVGARRWG